MGDMKFEEQLEGMNSLNDRKTSLENELSEMRNRMDGKEAELQEERLNNDVKTCTIAELNNKLNLITEENIRMKSENDKGIEDLELSKKGAEDEHLSQQEVAKEKMMQLEEAMSVQQQQHLSCWMYLKSMEVKLGIRDAELNAVKVKCSHYVKMLNENEKEMTKLRVEKEDYSLEIEE